MAVRHPQPGSPAEVPRVGDTVVLRPTSRQRIGSALLKSLCASPLLLALPVTTGGQRTIIIWVAIISAVAAVAIDLLADRDVWVKLSPTGLTTRAGSIPWWAVDEIKVREDLTSVTVQVRSFETVEMVLPAPRNGPTGANPHFDSEVRLIMANWRRYNRVVPPEPPRLQAVLDRAEASVREARSAPAVEPFDAARPFAELEGGPTEVGRAEEAEPAIDLRDPPSTASEPTGADVEPDVEHPAAERT